MKIAEGKIAFVAFFVLMFASLAYSPKWVYAWIDSLSLIYRSLIAISMIVIIAGICAAFYYFWPGKDSKNTKLFKLFRILEGPYNISPWPTNKREQKKYQKSQYARVVNKIIVGPIVAIMSIIFPKKK